MSIFLSPNETINELGTKKEFESGLIDIADEDLDEKLNQEYQDEMRDSL